MVLVVFNERFLPQLGYRKRAYMMNALIPGPKSSKMSSSIPNPKTGFLDTSQTVEEKIGDTACEDGVVIENGLLALLREDLLPISQLRAEDLNAVKVLEKYRHYSVRTLWKEHSFRSKLKKAIGFSSSIPKSMRILSWNYSQSNCHRTC